MRREAGGDAVIRIAAEVEAALATGQAVVGLETTLVAHGLPEGEGLAAGLEAERRVRERDAVPATVGVLDGALRIGLEERELERFATGARKVSTRDLGAAVAQRAVGATTAGATLAACRAAGIRFVATGGLGGVHRGAGFDESADLVALAHAPLAVVCSGVKSILDVGATLERLETLGVPVVGYGCDEFPGFYLRSTGEPVSARVDTPAEAAKLVATHWALGGAGVLLAQAVLEKVALSAEEFDRALAAAERQAAAAGVRGAAVTPFLLARLEALSSGATLRTNIGLIVHNARTAARIATARREARATSDAFASKVR
jgi:pseudouridine-5'-phosphate glycosidase